MPKKLFIYLDFWVGKYTQKLPIYLGFIGILSDYFSTFLGYRGQIILINYFN